MEAGESRFDKDKTSWSDQRGSQSVEKPLVVRRVVCDRRSTGADQKRLQISANKDEAAIIDYAAVKRLSLLDPAPPSSLKAPSKFSSRRRKKVESASIDPAPSPVPAAYHSSDEDAPPPGLSRSNLSTPRKSTPSTPRTPEENSLHQDAEEGTAEAIRTASARSNEASARSTTDENELTPQDNHYLNKIFTWCVLFSRSVP